MIPLVFLIYYSSYSSVTAGDRFFFGNFNTADFGGARNMRTPAYLPAQISGIGPNRKDFDHWRVFEFKKARRAGFNRILVRHFGFCHYYILLNDLIGDLDRKSVV